MAIIVGKNISFAPSPSPDVVGYRLYFCDESEDVTAVGTDGLYAAQAYDLGDSTSANLSNVVGSVDGVYNIGVTAIDDAGNESDMSVVNSVPLDFIAPDAPGPITIV